MNTLIHIGMPKAGSTYFQINFFEKMKNINYFTITDQLVRDIIYLNTLEFKKKYIENIFDLDSYLDRKKNTIISCEALTYLYDQFLICDRLKQIFTKNVTIMIVIRNQYDLLQSYYLHRLADGVYVSFNKFLKQQFLNKEISILPKLNYYELIKYYETLFGTENVKVLLFEDLFKNEDNKNIYTQENFFKQKFNFTLKSDLPIQNISIPTQLVPLKCLMNYLIRYDAGLGDFDIGTRGINEKKPKKSFQLYYKLLSNIFFKNKFFQSFFKKKPLYLNDIYKKKIFETFSESNKKLQYEYRLNLKENNYPVS